MKNYFLFALILLLKPGFAIQQEDLQTDKSKIFVLSKKAQLMENQLKFDSVFLYYDTATNLALKNNDSTLLNYVKLYKGKSFINKGDFDTAKIILTDVWNYTSKNNIDSLRAQSENFLGSIFQQEKLMGYALKYFESALATFEKENDTIHISQTFNYLSNYYIDAAEYNKSLDYSLKAIRLAQYKKDQDLLMKLLFNLGNVYETMGLYDSAESSFRKVYDYGLQNNNLIFANRSLYNIGLMYYYKGNKEFNENNIEKASEYFKQAEDLYLKSIENIESIGDKNQLSLFYAALGPIYRKLKEYEKAHKSYDKALFYAKEDRNIGRQIMILKNMGMLYRTEGDYQTAKKYMLESLKMAEEVNDKIGERDAYNSLAVLYEMMGDYKESNKYLEKYVDIYKSIVKDEKIKSSNEMLFAFEREKDEQKIKELLTQKTIADLEKKSIRSERNAILGISITAVFLLILILFYFRMKARTNRIIDAQRIQKLEDEKKLLAAQSLIVGQENERKRIAQELHDGIGVLLSAASIHFSSVSKTSGDKKTIEMLSKAEDLLKQAGGEVRKISQNMMPVVLSKFGLQEALEDMFEKLDEIDGLNIEAKIALGEERLPENTEIMLFRVIQEMINNTLKHAHAKNINFTCEKKSGNIILDFSDDGNGFDLENLPHNKSLGVFGIKSRIDFLNGKLEIVTGVGKGTHYQISIPISNH